MRAPSPVTHFPHIFEGFFKKWDCREQMRYLKAKPPKKSLICENEQFTKFVTDYN